MLTRFNSILIFKIIRFCVRYLICGSFVFFSCEEADYTLDNPNQGLYIPAMWWGKMLVSGGAQLLGLASDEFSEEDYIRNKEDFNGAV